MSPQRNRTEPRPEALVALGRMAATAGDDIRDARRRRRWSLRELADRAGVSPAAVQDAESGRPASLAMYARILTALGLQPELHGVDPRRMAPFIRDEDPVHAAMGEFEARHLRGLGFNVAMDEPYQHYQFAGRADLVAWDLERRALLHVENRTRFPNTQEAFGAYNAKRTYLARVLAERLGVGPRGWDHVANAMACLWSAEVLHALRLRTESFRAVCPDAPEDFAAWWRGVPPSHGISSTLVILDPSTSGRARPWVGFDGALRVRPRFRGYADAASAQ